MFGQLSFKQSSKCVFSVKKNSTRLLIGKYIQIFKTFISKVYISLRRIVICNKSLTAADKNLETLSYISI